MNLSCHNVGRCTIYHFTIGCYTSRECAEVYLLIRSAHGDWTKKTLLPFSTRSRVSEVRKKQTNKHNKQTNKNTFSTTTVMAKRLQFRQLILTLHEYEFHLRSIPGFLTSTKQLESLFFFFFKIVSTFFINIHEFVVIFLHLIPNSSIYQRIEEYTVGVLHTSSVASPICQEGQSERTFPIFAFSSRFSSFFPDFCLFFPIFLFFPRFFPIFGKFFAVRGGILPPPPCPQWLHHCSIHKK